MVTDPPELRALKDAVYHRRRLRKRARIAHDRWVEGPPTILLHWALLIAQEAARGARIQVQRAEAVWLAVKKARPGQLPDFDPEAGWDRALTRINTEDGDAGLDEAAVNLSHWRGRSFRRPDPSE